MYIQCTCTLCCHGNNRLRIYTSSKFNMLNFAEVYIHVQYKSKKPFQYRLPFARLPFAFERSKRNGNGERKLPFVLLPFTAYFRIPKTLCSGCSYSPPHTRPRQWVEAGLWQAVCFKRGKKFAFTSATRQLMRGIIFHLGRLTRVNLARDNFTWTIIGRWHI